MGKTLEKKSTSQQEDFRNIVLEDYKLANISRETSLLGRREVLTGKAKFGIFGDGKEVAQIAWAKAFQKGDFRSGYYRDQTFMMAIGALTVKEFFASLYANTNVEKEPASAGRQMNGHFATRSLNADGTWKNLMEQYNVSADISPTAGQMPRLVGLAEASKHYRVNELLHEKTQFSNKGNEVAWGTIGNASTSEGPFFEAINAAGVLQVPMVMSVWDDEYGISVHAKHQTTKESISEILAGFQRTDEKDGYEIFTVKGWDYPALIEAYENASKIAREQHIPVLIHVNEMTQPQGHSTSGTHERYKSKERLQWEQDFDCIKKLREFIEKTGLATAEELDLIEKDAKKHVRTEKGAAWKEFIGAIKEDVKEVSALLDKLAGQSTNGAFVGKVKSDLEGIGEPLFKDTITAARQAIRLVRGEDSEARTALIQWLEEKNKVHYSKFSSLLHSESAENANAVEGVAPTYADQPESVDARIVLRENFDHILSNRPEVMIFGEDSGKIGDVNQGLEGLQDKHGENRVYDTGIRECTILGQGIGMAMRGLRPIAEIQYLDYLLYALQIMSDDLATVQYRTFGGQKAPVIVRTRGHRLEGIWHSGSPMGAVINALRGVNILVPRNMTVAAGFYNTMLQSDEPALIVECLNGYRLKEDLPTNLGEFKTPLGVVETIKEGKDITLVTYGSCCRIAMDAASELEKAGISVEVIDIQSLLPFDNAHDIVKSLEKTNRVVFLDEDVPGGATAYMMQQVVEKQEGYRHLDSKPKTISARAHRPAYGTDGDYFSKPSVDDVFEALYAMMNEVDPTQYPSLY
jgi:pyruvate/2-oxoglutarate/acetoin dehydrogenase E1 component/TPP-dependent pyruvate/acetoin dehydrogenase alpha subunit